MTVICALFCSLSRHDKDINEIVNWIS